jgi:SAM-dependent methyltransferase
MRVLDLGCGPGELVPYLGGTEYIGVDLSGDYIARARELFPGSPEFRVGDATAPPNDLGQFDLVVAFGVVHHIDDRGAARMARAAAAALRPGGRYLTVDPTYQNGQSPIARAIISRDRGQHVREPEGYYALVEPVFDRVEQFVRHDLLRLPYSHCILSCSGPRNP